MSNHYRGPSKDASYQVSIHLAKRFQRRIFFRNQPIRNKNCLWRPCLLTDRDEMSILYRGHDIDASYQVSVHLAKRFQRRRFKKSANQKQELPMAAMFVNGSGQNEQYLERTFHWCFLPSFTSFGWGVSEEKIKMWKVNRRRTPRYGKSSGLSNQLREIYSICRCFWNVVTYKWKVHNGKIEIISFVVKFRS